MMEDGEERGDLRLRELKVSDVKVGRVNMREQEVTQTLEGQSRDAGTICSKCS